MCLPRPEPNVDSPSIAILASGQAIHVVWMRLGSASRGLPCGLRTAGLAGLVPRRQRINLRPLLVERSPTPASFSWIAALSLQLTWVRLSFLQRSFRLEFE